MNSHAAVPHDSKRLSLRVTFPGGNGFELAGIVDTPDFHHIPGSVPAPRPVVVFSHCFTCNKDLKAIVRTSRLLASSGVTVLRYDMTGLGGSGGDFSSTGFTSNLADLRAAILYASQTLGPVTGLIGHSFGGAASLAVGGDPQHAPPSLAAIATLAAPSDTHHLADLMEWRNPRIAIDGAGEVEIGGRRWTITREMLADFRRHELSRFIATITVPMLVFHSPSDETVNFGEAANIVRLARSASASLVALDGADHLLGNQPSDLAFVAGILSAFFHRYC